MLRFFGELANYYIHQQRIRQQNTIVKRVLRDFGNPFTIGDELFQKLYRMYPPMAQRLIQLIEHRLTAHRDGVPPHLQVLAVLRFLGDGSYQKAIGQDLNQPMCQSTFSKYLHRVIPAINSLVNRYIRFPRTAAERAALSRRFERRLGFPGVLGAVDCTLPKIKAPSQHEWAYLNYKRQHSLCVQVVSDLDYNILSIRIVNGSTNDRFAWRYSDARDTMYALRQDEDIAQEEGHYYVIGDRGYSLSRVLLTAVPNSIPGSPEREFSRNLRRARCFVEMLFGLLKQKWRILHKERSMHYDPIFAAQITQACAILHNFLRREGMPLEPLLPENREIGGNPVDDNDIVQDEEFARGLEERDRIIRTYFAPRQ